MDITHLVLTLLLSRCYHTSVTNSDPQLEALCKLGELVLQKASMKPLDSIVLDAANWQGTFEALSALIAANEIDTTAVDEELLSFVLKIDGSTRFFQCRVPLRNFDGTLVYCAHQVQRRDRILRHVKDMHLHYRPFVCGERCGRAGWWSTFPYSHVVKLVT